MGIISKKAGIEHIDANIMIRLITMDNPEMARRAKKLISKKNKVYILEDTIIMELVFVLTGNHYNLTRQEAAESIKTALAIESIYCNKSIIESALDLYVSHPKLSFVDCYLAIITDTTQEKPLWTFDKKLLAQCPLAREP